MHLLTFAGIIFIALGTALTIYGQQIINTKSSESLQKKSDESIVLSQLNIKLSEINSELTRQSLNQITGGDSWAYLAGGIPTLEGVANQPFMLVLNHVGKDPLREVKVEISNIEFNNNTINKSHTLRSIYTKEIGSLPNTLQPKSLDIFMLPNKNRVDLKVNLNALNGEIIQHWIFIKKENGFWTTANKVFKFIPNKEGGFSKVELFEKIDTDFPVKDISWIEV